LRKDAGYSLINIAGLAGGIAACLLIFSYTRFETSYDSLHPNVDRTYRVNQTAIWSPEGGMMGSTSLPLSKTLTDLYPEVEATTRINTPGGAVMQYESKSGDLITYREQNIFAADSNFFEFFQFPLIEGNIENALQGRNKVVISQQAAERFFGGESALGKILLWGDNAIPVEVTGVTETQAENVHFHFDYLLSMYTNPRIKQFEWSWIWTQVATYARLVPGASATSLEAKFPDIAMSYVQSTFSRLGMNYEEFVADKGGWNYTLQPVQDIHLHSDGIGNRLGPIGNSKTLNMLLVLAGLILLMAVINFINLSTARASTRAKEVGVKKTLGALRGSLIAQFQVESITITVIATIFGIALLELLKPVIQQLADVPFSTNFLYSWPYLLILPLIPLVIGFVAGLYPSFYLTAFKPIQVLKGQLTSGVKTAGLRNGLVAGQFTISIALMAGTLLVFQQLQFLSNKNLGFDKENILVINDAEQLGDQIETFRNELMTNPQIASAAIAMDMPGRGSWEDIYMREGSEIKLPISQVKIDEHFFPTMGFELSRGRAFDKERSSDRDGLIINETTARMFDWTLDEAVGKKILYPGYPRDLTIIGIVNDFHFQSLHQNIAPLMFFNVKSSMWGDQRVVAVKYRQDEANEVITAVQSTWNRISHGAPFDYSFLDEELDQLYVQEARLMKLVAFFTGFSIFIALLGLVGMVAYLVAQRRKEIGIRKVLGASATRIMIMVNGLYVKLVFLAIALAIPLSWWVMQNWLESFAYRIDINPVIFVFAGLAEIVLAVLCVGYLTMRAASVNPAQVLKDE
jgi:putative ABC transport system permease protein